MSVLRWHHVDWKRRVAILPPELHKTGKKTNKPRMIVLPVPAFKLLQFLHRRASPDPNALVFLSSRRNAWTRCSLSQRIKRMRKRAGLPRDCQMYGLRHKFGTDGVRKKTHLKTLATLMGHTTTRMTEGYVHVGEDVDHLHEAIEQMTHRNGKPGAA